MAAHRLPTDLDLLLPMNPHTVNRTTVQGLFLIAWLADGDSLMCCIVMIGRQIALDVLYIFSVRISVSHDLP